MGRSKERNDGGQRRTIVCGCGWSYMNSPDRMLKAISLHAKRCEVIDLDSFRGLPNTRIYDNAYLDNTPKGTSSKAVQFIDGMPSRIDFAKNNMSHQINTNYQAVCKLQELD